MNYTRYSVEPAKERNALMAEVVYEKARKTIWQQQYEAAIEQRDVLASAAKLALDALDHHPFNYKMNPAECAVHQQAIDAIKSAGVQ